MTEQLLIELSSRLPYGLICNVRDNSINKDYRLTGVNINGCEFDDNGAFYGFNNFEIKPYLRPISSMTEEEIKELDNIEPSAIVYGVPEPEFVRITDDMNGYGVKMNAVCRVINFLNAHHFDYRELIEKGLVLPAPESMYNIN